VNNLNNTAIHTTDALNTLMIQKVLEAWLQCQKHLYHLEHALKLIKPFLPVTAAYITTQTDEQIQAWDQFVLRFTKLQDTLGARFYPALLNYLQEPCATHTMLDKLNRLEKLGLLNKASDWNALRSIRNQFAHDYPQDAGLKAAYLNEAIAAVEIFKDAMFKAEQFMSAHKLIKTN
jgi:phytoene dehydrogenase-like protein